MNDVYSRISFPKEIRTDALKYLTERRRPLPKRAENIGEGFFTMLLLGLYKIRHIGHLCLSGHKNWRIGVKSVPNISPAKSLICSGLNTDGLYAISRGNLVLTFLLLPCIFFF